jgi:hypothetical protein
MQDITRAYVKPYLARLTSGLDEPSWEHWSEIFVGPRDAVNDLQSSVGARRSDSLRDLWEIFHKNEPDCHAVFWDVLGDADVYTSYVRPSTNDARYRIVNELPCFVLEDIHDPSSFQRGADHMLFQEHVIGFYNRKKDSTPFLLIPSSPAAAYAIAAFDGEGYVLISRDVMNLNLGPAG